MVYFQQNMANKMSIINQVIKIDCCFPRKSRGLRIIYFRKNSLENKTTMDQSTETIPFSPDPESTLYQGKEQSSVLSLKKSRRQLQFNVQSLANRIAVLQQEEEKILKSIGAAKTKALELSIGKKKDLDKSREQQIKLEDSQGSWQNNQQYYMRIRKEREENLKLMKEAIQRQKHEEMLEIKKQSELCKLKRQDIEDKLIQENRSKMLHIKQEGMIGEMRKKYILDEKIKRIKRMEEKKMKEDQEFKKAKEMEVMNLKRLEMEMSERIQQSKLLKKQVHRSLEKILLGRYDDSILETLVGSPNLTESVNIDLAKSLDGSLTGDWKHRENILKTQIEIGPFSKGIIRHQSSVK